MGKREIDYKILGGIGLIVVGIFSSIIFSLVLKPSYFFFLFLSGAITSLLGAILIIIGALKKYFNRKTVGNGLGISGFVLGILSILFFWLFFLGIPLSILGIIFSVAQRKKHHTKIATTGLILSIIGIVMGAILFAATVVTTFLM